VMVGGGWPEDDWHLGNRMTRPAEISWLPVCHSDQETISALSLRRLISLRVPPRPAFDVHGAISRRDGITVVVEERFAAAFGLDREDALRELVENSVVVRLAKAADLGKGLVEYVVEDAWTPAEFVSQHSPEEMARIAAQDSGPYGNTSIILYDDILKAMFNEEEVLQHWSAADIDSGREELLWTQRISETEALVRVAVCWEAGVYDVERVILIPFVVTRPIPGTQS